MIFSEYQNASNLQDLYLLFEPTKAVQIAENLNLPDDSKLTSQGLIMPLKFGNGQMSWVADPQDMAKDEPNYLSLRLMNGEKEITSNAVLLAEAKYHVDDKTGGEIDFQNGLMKVSIPGKAISENLLLDIRPPTPTPSEMPAMTETPSPTEAPQATKIPTPEETVEEGMAGEETPTQEETVIDEEDALLVKSPTLFFSSAIYVYDGDNKLVKSVVNDITTYYPYQHFIKAEVPLPRHVITTTHKMYFGGSTMFAERSTIDGAESHISWLLSDHLGSTSITVRANGTKSAELRYSAFSFALRALECYAGETKYMSGTTPTDYRYIPPSPVATDSGDFAGQLQQEAINLYYYSARWYDPKLGVFTQADTNKPTGTDPQSWDRYAYVKNNPLKPTVP